MSEPQGIDVYLQSLNRRIERRLSTAAPEVTADRWAFREAAAVLVTFDLGRLRPVPGPGVTPDASASLLLPDIVPTPLTGSPGSSMLVAEIRKAAIARLQARSAIPYALEANPDRPRNEFQALFEEWLIGKPPDLESQNYSEFLKSAQIASWIDGVIPNVPSAAEVQRRLNRRSVYGLFDHLATEDFTGRTNELRQLREYVGVLEPTTMGDSLRRQLRDWSGERRRPPMTILGAGGVGKSALLGKFLGDHAKVPEQMRFPFAYLPLDNPFLRVEEPGTLITEMKRQLELLQGDRTELFERFDEQNLRYRRTQRALDERTVQLTRLQRAGALQESDLTVYEAFSSLVNALCSRGNAAAAPFLMVLDTFEEAQYRGSERLIGLMRMLSALHRMCRSLRILIVSRPPLLVPTPPELGTPIKLDLHEFSRTEAQSVLMRMGVADPKLADTIAVQVGGNPLNLRLAARLVEHDLAGKKGIQGIETSSYFFFSLSTEMIRGQLYARILDHIHNPDVRALAHPGMVLRRVDPELIRDVLAGPCGVEVPTIERAQELFEELSREHTLLEPAEQGAVRYRTDIRQATLGLLQQDRPGKVREIHEGAVRYYSARDGDPVSHTEELYHRLSLNEDPSQLGTRWDASTVSSLIPSLAELPPRAQAWLAARAGLDLPSESRELASLEEWEQLVGRKVRDLLRYTEPEQALQVLSERKARVPGSPLYAFEAKALMFLDRFGDALQVLQRGIDSMPQAPNRGRLAELLWLNAQVLERQARLTESAAVLARAEEVAENIADPFCRLQILAQQLLLRHDRRATFPQDDERELRARLATVFARIPDGELDRERSLTRTALSFLGPSYLAEFARGIGAVGVGAIDGFALKDISERLESIGPVRGEVKPELSALIDDLQHDTTDASSILERCLNIPEARSAVAPVLVDVLNKQRHSLSAANLAGIDEYREPWELELPQEAA